MSRLLTTLGALVLAGGAAAGGFWYAKSGRKVPFVKSQPFTQAPTAGGTATPDAPGSGTRVAEADDAMTARPISQSAAPAGPSGVAGLEVVENVITGDTIKMSSGRVVTLTGVLAPRQGEAYFAEVREALLDLVGNNPLTVEPAANGKSLLWRGNILINEQLVRRGMSRTWGGEGGLYAARLKAAEKAASQEGIGYWSPHGWMGARP